jgi:hypothetical protein
MLSQGSNASPHVKLRHAEPKFRNMSGSNLVSRQPTTGTITIGKFFFGQKPSN